MDIAFSTVNWLLTETPTNDNNDNNNNSKNNNDEERVETKSSDGESGPLLLIQDKEEEEEEDSNATTETMSLPHTDAGAEGDDEMDPAPLQMDDERTNEPVGAGPIPDSNDENSPPTGSAAEKGGKDGDEPKEPAKTCAASTQFVPLLDYLCKRYNCSIQNLQLLLFSVEMRRKIIADLRTYCELRTTHLRPVSRNMLLRCDDFSCQSATNVFAFNGFLNITVRQYYFSKHQISLRHPYLPCLIVFGGGSHRSYFPIELIAVRRKLSPFL